MARGYAVMFLVMIIGLAFAFMWNAVPAIGSTTHAVLDPTLGKFLDLSPKINLIVFVLILTAVLTLIQKYTTNQAEMKRLKQEQKDIQQELKKHTPGSTEYQELMSKSLAIAPKMLDLTSGSLIYTALPIILLFRWFNDYFTVAPVKIIGLSWFWAYLIFSIIFSIILRKVFKVA